MRSTRRLAAQLQYWLGLLIVLGFIFVAIAAPLLSPNDTKNPGPMKIVGRAIDFTPRPPKPGAPLGTLPGQASVYHILVWGTRSALIFGVTAAFFTAVLGVVIGATSAYFGGTANRITMQVTDAFLAFPVIAGVVLIHQVLAIILDSAGVVTLIGGGTSGMPNPSFATTLAFPDNISAWYVLLSKLNPVLIAFVVFSWPSYARVMNATTQTIMQMEYIQAVRALGAGHSTVIFRHLIPNGIAPMIILAARDVGGMVLMQATFTFIGLGGDSLWGKLLVLGRNWIIGPGGNILTYWWLFVPVTIALVLFGIAWNLLGDFFNELLDPRLR